MTKDSCLKLLKFMKENGILFQVGVINIEMFFEMPQIIVDKLLNITTAWKFKYALKFLNDLYKDEIDTQLSYKISGLEIINKCEKNFQAIYAISLLCNYDLIDSGNALEGASLVSKCMEDFQAEYMASAISKNVDLESVKIINESKKDFQAKYISISLSSGVPKEDAILINDCEFEYNALYMNEVLCNKNARKAMIAVDGAKIIYESSEQQAFYEARILCDKKIIDSGNALEGAKLVNKCKTDTKMIAIYEVLRDEETIKSGIALSEAQRISEIDEDYFKKPETKISDILSNELLNYTNPLKRREQSVNPFIDIVRSLPYDDVNKESMETYIHTLKLLKSKKID